MSCSISFSTALRLTALPGPPPRLNTWPARLSASARTVTHALTASCTCRTSRTCPRPTHTQTPPPPLTREATAHPPTEPAAPPPPGGVDNAPHKAEDILVRRSL